MISQSLKCKRRLSIGREKIFDKLRDGECSTDRHAKRIDCVDSCDAGNRRCRNIDSSSASWRYENNFDGLVTIEYKVLIGSVFNVVDLS